MTLDEYQKLALKTASVPDFNQELAHRVLGLVGETGEIAEKLKKIYRDHGGDVKKLDINDIKSELGDVLWYLATLADLLGISFEEIGTYNIEKLADRQKRGKLGGSGDNR